MKARGAQRSVLQVAAEPPRCAGAPPALVDVAVGILRDAQGRFLLTSRPSGKVYAGYWEFPGGKFEPGEALEQALQRELQEELGIQCAQVQPWHQALADYPHARVRLHFCHVPRWSGEVQMLEAQSCCWQHLPVSVNPLLPAMLPVLQWLQQEQLAGAAQLK